MSTDSRIFRAIETPDDEKETRRKLIPPAPPWRAFADDADKNRGRDFIASEAAIEVVNAALCLRRPILVEGGPGLGKTTLAYAVARELGLPGPYRWGITSRSVLRDGLYLYDAVGRLQAANIKRGENQEPPPIGDYLKLGPLGMGMLQSEPQKPAVVLIDEIDKGDQDLPNDLLHLFEEGEFEIPEIQRLRSDKDQSVMPCGKGEPVRFPASGRLVCKEFPLIIMTSNGEREFPGPFLRRCLRVKLELPKGEALAGHLQRIVETHFKGTQSEAALLAAAGQRDAIIRHFASLKEGSHAVDQLLNAMHLLLRGDDVMDREELRKRVFEDLSA